MQNNEIIYLDTNCMFYPTYKVVYHNNQIIKLTGKQAELLKTLVEYKNILIKSEELYYKIWHDSDIYKSKSLRNLISELKKLLPSLSIVNYYGEGYLLKYKDSNILSNLKDTIQVFDQMNNGICITNPNMKDNPIIYVNKFFTDIFQYKYEEIVGKNCRFLQNNDTKQENINLIRMAIKEKKPITTVVRNYKKNGVLVYSEVSISPIFDLNSKEIKFFIGVQKIIDSKEINL